MVELSPRASEFATTEEATAYEQWLRAKVQASLDDPRPSIPHDHVMGEIDIFLNYAEHDARKPD